MGKEDRHQSATNKSKTLCDTRKMYSVTQITQITEKRQKLQFQLHLRMHPTAMAITVEAAHYIQSSCQTAWLRPNRVWSTVPLLSHIVPRQPLITQALAAVSLWNIIIKIWIRCSICKTMFFDPVYTKGKCRYFHMVWPLIYMKTQFLSQKIISKNSGQSGDFW